MTARPTTRFAHIFERDGEGRTGVPRFRIRGSGVQTQPDCAPLTARIVERLRREGIAVARRAWGSAGNANSYHLDASFADGGFHATTGNYWMAPRGAWIEGEQAVTWLANLLGLQPPSGLGRKHPPRLADALVAAYAATDFVVLDPPPIHLTVGACPPEALLQRMAEARASTAAIVTSWNPFSQPLPDSGNRMRQMQLLHDLRARGLEFHPAEGRDRNGRWPAEDSLLILGLSLETANSLLVRYQQHALVWIRVDAPVELLFHPR